MLLIACFSFAHSFCKSFPRELLLMGSSSPISLVISFCFVQEDTYRETTEIHWAVLNSLKNANVQHALFK